MVSFLSLLLLSLSALARIETAAASSQRSRIIARQNALFGLRIALGRLQKIAGPDQRVTTTAAAFAETAEGNRHWTGVWDSARPDQGPIWMVSGVEPEHQVPLDPRSSVEIVGRNTVEQPDQHVRVAKVPVGLGNSRGNIAYWIGDEGLKASVGISQRELESRASNGGLAEWERRRLRQMMAGRFSPQFAFRGDDGSPLFDPDSEELQSVIGKIRDRKDYSFLSNRIGRRKRRSRFHDLTPRAMGLLVSPGHGLKRDLSVNPDSLGSEGFRRYMDYDSYMVRPEDETHQDFRGSPESLRRRYRISAPSTLVEGDICHSVAPVLTDFYMLFTVTKGKSNGIVVRYRMHVELWNLYTSALQPEDLELEVTGLPLVRLETEDGQVREIDLQKTLNNESRPDTPLVIVLPFRDNPNWPGEDDHSWLPGRIYSWIAPNNASRGAPKSENGGEAQFYSRAMNNGIWEEEVQGILYPEPRGQRFKIVSPFPTFLSVRLRRAPGKGGGTLVKFSRYRYDDFETSYYKSTQRPLQFGYRFRIFEPGDLNLTKSGWSKSLWIRNNDPRDPNPRFGKVSEGASYFPPNGYSPDSYTLVKIKQPQWLFDRTQGKTGKNYMEDVPLFELPRQPQVSLGALQHLQIIGRPPFSIGNSWGSGGEVDLNASFFERFFFSGLASSSHLEITPAGARLPNSRLRLYGGGRAKPLDLRRIFDPREETAGFYLVDGAFNVNSTSPTAWEVILGALQLRNWRYVDLDEREGDIETDGSNSSVAVRDLEQSFLRFSQSGEETFETGPHTSLDHQLEPPTQYFRIGVKTVSDQPQDSSRSQLQQLARNLADNVRLRIRTRGPYRSMSEFLAADPIFGSTPNSTNGQSALEAAIAAVPSINLDGANEIYHRVSNFLTSADILTALAPILTVRSDTFLIRAYGDAANPVTGELEGRAWCEALVQRVPSLVDPSDQVQHTRPNGFGRRFKIVKFSWLSSSNI